MKMAEKISNGQTNLLEAAEDQRFSYDEIKVLVEILKDPVARPFFCGESA